MYDKMRLGDGKLRSDAASFCFPTSAHKISRWWQIFQRVCASLRQPWRSPLVRPPTSGGSGVPRAAGRRPAARQHPSSPCPTQLAAGKATRQARSGGALGGRRGSLMSRAGLWRHVGQPRKRTSGGNECKRLRCRQDREEIERDPDNVIRYFAIFQFNP